MNSPELAYLQKDIQEQAAMGTKFIAALKARIAADLPQAVVHEGISTPYYLRASLFGIHWVFRVESIWKDGSVVSRIAAYELRDEARPNELFLNVAHSFDKHGNNLTVRSLTYDDFAGRFISDLFTHYESAGIVFRPS